MFAKISLTAAFLLLSLPPMACALNYGATSPASTAWLAHESPTAGIVVAQQGPPIGIYENEKNQTNEGTTENENENENDDAADKDANDNGDDNQNADANQNADGTATDQENTAGNQQSIPPQVLGGNENEAGNGQPTQSINPFTGGAQLVAPMNGFQQPNQYQ
jgi:hypothetical protein